MCDPGAKLNGKVAIVTGGSSGIGLEAAKDLAYRGARVIIASRNETKLKIARDQIENDTGNQDITYKVLDLGSLDSVRKFTREIANENRLDILVNNAGAVGLPDKLTADDLNLTMQVNFFGTFLLTYLLLPLLMTSAPSRIINASGTSKYVGQINFDTWNDVGQPPFAPISNSQLALNLFTVELDKRLKGSGVTANGYDPFIARDTKIFNNISGVAKEDVIQHFLNTVGQSNTDIANEIGYLASAPELERVSGMNYILCKNWPNHWLADDVILTRNLWDRAKQLVKITPKEDWESRKMPIVNGRLFGGVTGARWIGNKGY